MIKISNASLKEKSLIKRVEKACFSHLSQPDFFVIDMTVADEDTIRALNASTRGIDRVTDVLSYPCFEGLRLPVSRDSFCDADTVRGRVILGSIMICRKRAEEQAREYGHSFERELGFLACHGFLHLLGFDHIDSEDEKIMLAHQKEIMSAVGLKR